MILLFFIYGSILSSNERKRQKNSFIESMPVLNQNHIHDPAKCKGCKLTRAEERKKTQFNSVPKKAKKTHSSSKKKESLFKYDNPNEEFKQSEETEYFINFNLNQEMNLTFTTEEENSHQTFNQESDPLSIQKIVSTNYEVKEITNTEKFSLSYESQVYQNPLNGNSNIEYTSEKNIFLNNNSEINLVHVYANFNIADIDRNFKIKNDNPKCLEFLNILFAIDWSKTIDLYSKTKEAFNIDKNANYEYFYNTIEFLNDSEHFTLEQYYKNIQANITEIESTPNDDINLNNSGLKSNFVPKNKYTRIFGKEYSFDDIIFDSLNNIYKYNNNFYSDFFKRCYSVTYYEKLEIREFDYSNMIKSKNVAAIDNDHIEGFNDATNFLLKNKIIDFEFFFKIIFGYKNKFYIPIRQNKSRLYKIHFFNIIKTYLKSAKTLIPSINYLERYIEKSENASNYKDVDLVCYSYFLEIFEILLNINWEALNTNLNSKIETCYLEYSAIPNKNESFLEYLISIDSKIPLEYYFIYRARLEINKIFLFLIKPLIGDQTAKKYAIFMFTENIVCSKQFLEFKILNHEYQTDTLINNDYFQWKHIFFLQTPDNFLEQCFIEIKKSRSEEIKSFFEDPHKISQNSNNESSFFKSDKSNIILKNFLRNKILRFEDFFDESDMVSKLLKVKTYRNNDLWYVYGLLGFFKTYYNDQNDLFYNQIFDDLNELENFVFEEIFKKRKKLQT